MERFQRRDTAKPRRRLSPTRPLAHVDRDLVQVTKSVNTGRERVLGRLALRGKPGSAVRASRKRRIPRVFRRVPMGSISHKPAAWKVLRKWDWTLFRLRSTRHRQQHPITSKRPVFLKPPSIHAAGPALGRVVQPNPAPIQASDQDVVQITAGLVL